MATKETTHNLIQAINSTQKPRIDQLLVLTVITLNLYTKSDQLLNKCDDLLMQIADNPPDINLITEVQTNPIE